MSAKRLAAGDSVIFIWYATLSVLLVFLFINLQVFVTLLIFVGCYSSHMCSTSSSESRSLLCDVLSFCRWGWRWLVLGFVTFWFFPILVSFLSSYSFLSATQSMLLIINEDDLLEALKELGFTFRKTYQE